MIDRTVSRGSRIAILACLLLAGCVPVPFKPSATVSQVPVGPGDAVLLVRSADGNEAHWVAKDIRADEPRVALVEAAAFSARIGPITGVTLSEALASARAGGQGLAADYVLSVGTPSHRILHHNGTATTPAYAPEFAPLIVGYDKWQSLETLPATLLDLRNPQSLQVLCASSAYSEVAAGFGYGFATFALSVPAVRQALAREVARTLAEAQPSGTIRLLVVSQAPEVGAPRSASGCLPEKQPELTMAALVPVHPAPPAAELAPVGLEPH